MLLYVFGLDGEWLVGLLEEPEDVGLLSHLRLQSSVLQEAVEGRVALAVGQRLNREDWHSVEVHPDLLQRIFHCPNLHLLSDLPEDVQEERRVPVLYVFVEVVEVEVADRDLADDLVALLVEQGQLVGDLIDVGSQPVDVSQVDVGRRGLADQEVHGLLAD